MRKAFDIAFTALVACVLAVVLAPMAVGALLQADSPTRSYLEGREYQQFPELSVESVQSGAFQDDFEQFAADHVPGRDSVLLANASMQRAFIEAANVPFGFDAYPTFYGSDYYAADGNQILLVQPYKKRATKKSFSNAVRRLSDVVKRHQDMTWCFALVNRSSTDAGSPLHDLISDVATYSYYEALAKKALGESCDIVNLEDIAPSSEDPLYFSTDHHWQVIGAFEAYSRIIQALGRNPIAIDGYVQVDVGGFCGSKARSGLMERYDTAFLDASYPHGDLEVRFNGDEKPLDAIDKGWAASTDAFQKADRFSNVYAEYFHGDYGLIELRNLGAGTGSLLIIGDSFSNNMERFFAESYRDVYVIDSRYYEGLLEDFLEAHEIDDVVVLVAANTVSNKAFSELLASPEGMKQ